MESDKTVIRQLRWLVLVNSLDTARKSDRERIYFNLEEETFRMESKNPRNSRSRGNDNVIISRQPSMELPYLVPRIEAALLTKSRKNRKKKKKKKKKGEGRKGETRVRSGGQAFCHRFPLFTGWIRLNEGSKWLILASRKSSALSRRVRNREKRTRRSLKFELERGDIARGKRGLVWKRNCWIL